MAQLGYAEYLLIGATLTGPILAVQAQKWVERAREANNRRQWVFNILMATRQARVSIDHVRALNSIDLAFYGRRVFGIPLRGAKGQAVLDAWHVYHAHLTLPPDQRPQNEAQQLEWGGRGDELFTNLLERLATATSFKFAREQLKGGSYSPEAHGAVELEQNDLRQLTVELLRGNRTLPLEVRTLHVDADAIETQKVFQQRLIELQTGVSDKLVDILDRLTPPRDHNQDGNS
jgi:hypothetical protein